jgi:hypothetical protein
VNIAVIGVLYQKKDESAIDLEAIDSSDDSDVHKESDDDNASDSDDVDEGFQSYDSANDDKNELTYELIGPLVKKISGENVSYVTNKKRRYSSKVHPRRIWQRSFSHSRRSNALLEQSLREVGKILPGN